MSHGWLIEKKKAIKWDEKHEKEVMSGKRKKKFNDQWVRECPKRVCLVFILRLIKSFYIV